MLKIKKVAIAVSGGVDSAVSALFLKNKGFDVVGVFMQNWDITDEKGRCSASEDYKDASYVCDKLNIKLYHVNFVKQYWNEVFSYLIKEYESGCTPNPDILCNRNVKFKHFYNYARYTLRADAIATGHYARTSFGPYLELYEPDKDVRLYRGEDLRKDQTFFLCQVQQEALRRTMFPLGSLLKSQVKRIAFENGLEKFANKRESMGICFIGSRNFQDFIREYIDDKPGDFIDVDTSKIVGQHEGIHKWTLGQRSRLHGLPEAYFIAKKNENLIYVAQGTEHPILFSKFIFTEKPHWIHSKPDELTNNKILRCEFKFQHTQHWVLCKVFEITKGLIIMLEEPKRAITSGQYAILSKNNECLGSARIENQGISEFSLQYFDKQKSSKYFK